MRQFRSFRWIAISAIVSSVIFLSGCTDSLKNGYLPGFQEGQPPVTSNTQSVSSLWTISWLVLVVVGAIVWILAIYALIVYRRRKKDTGLPPQDRYHMPLEALYTIIPLILVVGFFAFTLRTQDQIEARLPADKVDEQIEVAGKQWAWDFNYIKENVNSPGIQAQLLTKNADGSVDQSQLPTLYLPVNKTIELKLTSRDVVHAFWVIDFLYKKDMFPGKTNYMTVTPTRVGTYAGKCTELCGEFHSLMLFNVKVVSQAEYDSYIKLLRDKGRTGLLDDKYNRQQNLPGTGAAAATKEG